MRKSILAIALALSIGLIGCAAVEQVREDIDLAKADTAISLAVKQDSEAAGSLAGTFLPVAESPTAWLVGTLLLWYKGRRKRLQLPHSTTPITSYIGGGKGLEGIAQTLANVSCGLFNWGEGSTKRAVKFAVVGTLALALLPVVTELPFVEGLIQSYPQITNAILVVLGALIASLEKALGRVLPIQSTGESGG